ncbi:MAG TPA: bifunctional isocitrate dehydrogenase kinase/phosphatase [Desulfosarcina sp.]|nr:bifunctional isocitrate dehydrogenase kinase/phosphatase [Desulfosarcina sp.]
MTPDPLAQSCAACIRSQFKDYRKRFETITRRAPRRFMAHQWVQLQNDAGERLDLYAHAVDRTEKGVRRLLGNRLDQEPLWQAAKQAYARKISGDADGELAETFFNSVTRRIFDTVGVNRRIEFVHDDPSPPRPVGAAPTGFRSYAHNGPLDSLLREILADFTAIALAPKPLEEALPIIAARLHGRLAGNRQRMPPLRVEMLRDPFYRGQGAYLIGRIVAGGRVLPLVMALLHPSTGVVVDALILDTDAVSIVFSYTRSAFHVPLDHPGELVAFIKTILPAKPAAEIYSAIGCFKHGKTVLYQDVCRHTAQCTQDRFRIAPGKRGMVMVVFDMAGYDMVVKLIRDRFDTPKRATRDKVMAQYEFVFKHYRVGRLIEAHTFEHLSFDRCWFTDELLDYLVSEAGRTVHLVEDRVIVDHAYLERRVTPLDIFLQQQTGDQADAAVLDFGNAIKDLALANIFPGDMLLKNFGVTRRGRVVFYDYDEIVPLTDCRFRNIPQARTYLEELADEPWYTVAENDVFPEEFSHFLGLSPQHRELFLSRHADLLTTGFWTSVQEDIRRGRMGHIRPYGKSYRLPCG